MKNPYTIRKVRKLTDTVIKILLKLDNACFPQDEPYNFNADGYQNWWIVYHKGEPVAYAGTEPYEGTRGVPLFCRVGVLPRHRGRGLHDRLIQVRLRYLKRAGHSRAITYTMSHNFKSTNNLTKHGFKHYANTGADPHPLWWEIKF